MMQVTPSKQWIHFFRSERCPPTSNILGEAGEAAQELRTPLLPGPRRVPKDGGA